MAGGVEVIPVSLYACRSSAEPPVKIDKLTVLTSADDAVALEARLGGVEIDPPLAVSRFLSGMSWQVDALFEAPLTLARIEPVLEGIALHTPLAIAPVPATNWVAHVERTLKPIAAGPFLVHGPHDRAAAAGHPYAIEIEAGGAFGTAHHATTQGCLAAIGEVLRDSRPKRILDLGTGSGILAIAAAKLSPDTLILATDIDPESVRIAEENAAINGVAARIRCLTADGLGACSDDVVAGSSKDHAQTQDSSHSELSEPAAFDVILANILAEPLVELAPGLRRALADGGSIVLSGLLAEQQAMVLSAYEREGLRLIAEWPVEGWMTMRVG